MVVELKEVLRSTSVTRRLGSYAMRNLKLKVKLAMKTERETQLGMMCRSRSSNFHFWGKSRALKIGFEIHFSLPYTLTTHCISYPSPALVFITNAGPRK